MFRIDDYDVIDATLHGNAARFINHSCEVRYIFHVLYMTFIICRVTQEHNLISAIIFVYFSQTVTRRSSTWMVKSTLSYSL